MLACGNCVSLFFVCYWVAVFVFVFVLCDEDKDKDKDCYRTGRVKTPKPSSWYFQGCGVIYWENLWNDRMNWVLWTKLLGAPLKGAWGGDWKQILRLPSMGPSLFSHRERSGHQMREVISHRRIHQPHCASICFDRSHLSHLESVWIETLTHFPATVTPCRYFDNSYFEIVKMLHWKEFSCSFIVL